MDRMRSIIETGSEQAVLYNSPDLALTQRSQISKFVSFFESKQEATQMTSTEDLSNSSTEEAKTKTLSTPSTPDSVDTLDNKRLKKFHKLVRHANENAPYYTRIIKQLGIDIETCVPQDFPVLDKVLLMENFDDIVTDRRISKQGIADFLTGSTDPNDLFLNKYIVMHTSGTSGQVGYFLNSSADQRRTFSGLSRSRRKEVFGAMGSPFKGIRRMRLAFYGATGGHYAGVTMVSRMQRGLPSLFVKAAAFEVNSPLPGIIDQLNDFKPDTMLGYTTALKILGEQQRQGILKISPSVILASGEMVTTADMDFLSESFGGARVVSAYGSTEQGMMGFSNPDQETMTLAEDNLIFECYEDHSLITNLFNFTMPLIRYRMSDILIPVSEKGADTTIVKNLVGRTELMPTFTNASGESDFISPHTINEVFVKGVTRFQMQITGDTSFRFPVCVETKLTEEERSTLQRAVQTRLHEILEQKGLSNVTFEAPIVDDIPLDKRTRKFRLIVDARKA